VLILLTVPVQWVVYAIVIRSVFELPGGRAILVALLRVGSGVAVQALLDRVIHPSLLTLHIVSAPIAWAAVAPFDPRISWRRMLLWMAMGTAATAGLDYVLFKTLLREDQLQMPFHGLPPPG
jgi:hypothetical protein